MMIRLISISLFTLILFIKANSQVIDLNNTDSTEIYLDKKVNGFGVKGNFSIGIATKDKMDSIELSACPIMKNIPDSLSNIVEYCIHLNRFQFFFQNYKNDVFSKEYFINEAKRQKWDLNDTILLSDRKFKNTISVAAGETPEGIGMYIVDANNNNDFSDDTLRTLLSDLYRQDVVLENSYPINIELFNGKSIVKDKQLLLVKSSRGGGMSLSFSFPQFRYGKFSYQGESHLVCAESYNPEQSIYVLEDRPYFSPPGRDKEVEPFQLVKLGDDYFRYTPLSHGMDKIVLSKIDNSDVQTKLDIGTSQTAADEFIPTSSQVGMIAPEIKGLNILGDSIISLYSLKGKYVFVDFWSTTCAPCIREFPNLKTVYEKYDRNQFEIIGVVDDRTKGKIQAFVKQRELSWPNISMNINTTDIKGYMIKSYPTTYLVNPKGKIIATNLRGDELLNKLSSLINE